MAAGSWTLRLDCLIPQSGLASEILAMQEFNRVYGGVGLDWEDEALEQDQQGTAVKGSMNAMHVGDFKPSLSEFNSKGLTIESEGGGVFNVDHGLRHSGTVGVLPRPLHLHGMDFKDVVQEHCRPVAGSELQSCLEDDVHDKERDDEGMPLVIRKVP